jgi:hypothetical protein
MSTLLLKKGGCIDGAGVVMDASVRDTKTPCGRGLSAPSGASCIDRPMHSVHVGPNILTSLWPVFRSSKWGRFQGLTLNATEWSVLNLDNKTETRTVYLPRALPPYLSRDSPYQLMQCLETGFQFLAV